MRKHIVRILSAVVMLMALALAVSACAAKPGGYSFTNPTPPADRTEPLELDEGTAIDGRAEESFWEGVPYLAFTEPVSGITVKSKAYLGEGGLYLYAETDDVNVYVSDERQFYENDSVEFYIDPAPEVTLSKEGLLKSPRVRDDCVQIRIDPLGACQTWVGRRIGNSGYPWCRFYYPAASAGIVNGEIDQMGGAAGYSVEAFVPYTAMLLTEKPERIGVMPAFNNTDNYVDTNRTWYSVRSMSQDNPSSFAPVTSAGFDLAGWELEPGNALDCDTAKPVWQNMDSVYLDEVDAANANAERRAAFKAYLGEDGLYVLAEVKDKVVTRYNSGIWDNDGIELDVDTLCAGGSTHKRDGLFRVGVDVDGGTQVDVCKTGVNDFVPVYRPVAAAVTTEEISGESAYGYRARSVYEVFVPYASLGLSARPAQITLTVAVKSPNEKAYIKDRKSATGKMEAQDWLWPDKHYPLNPGEYYYVTASGFDNPDPETFVFPVWKDFSEVPAEAQSPDPDRWNMQAYARPEGIYLYMVQYVPAVVQENDNWSNTHVEFQVWNDSFGYAMKNPGNNTFVALFLDGTYYVNDTAGLKHVIYRKSVTDLGAGETDRYKVEYQAYLDFDNASSTAVKFLTCTPGDTAYLNSPAFTLDGRALRTHQEASLAVDENGIVTPYRFPAWKDFASIDAGAQSPEPEKWNMQAYTAADGLYVYAVQYVDSYEVTNEDNWANTHVEMQVWSDSFGQGKTTAGTDTFLAFFLDATYYCNNMDGIEGVTYRTHIARNEPAAASRYTVEYQIRITYPNTTDTALRIMMRTPGETGYVDSVHLFWEGRPLWTHHAGKLAVDTDGIQTPTGFDFPALKDFSAVDASLQSPDPTRWNAQAYAKSDGLYLYMVQYVDEIKRDAADNFANTHVEMNIWQADFGFGWGGTFVGLFLDGSYYINNQTNVTGLRYEFAIADLGAGHTGGRYRIEYRFYIGFPNNVGSADGPYAFVKFKVCTPGDTAYPNSTQIEDGGRVLFTDDGKSFSVKETGIVEKMYS